MDPQLKFLPPGTMSKVWSRTSLSSSPRGRAACEDVWRSGCDEVSVTGISELDSAGKSP